MLKTKWKMPLLLSVFLCVLCLDTTVYAQDDASDSENDLQDENEQLKEELEALKRLLEELQSDDEEVVDDTKGSYNHPYLSDETVELPIYYRNCMYWPYGREDSVGDSSEIEKTDEIVEVVEDDSEEDSEESVTDDDMATDEASRMWYPECPYMEEQLGLATIVINDVVRGEAAQEEIAQNNEYREPYDKIRVDFDMDEFEWVVVDYTFKLDEYNFEDPYSWYDDFAVFKADGSPLMNAQKLFTPLTNSYLVDVYEGGSVNHKLAMLVPEDGAFLIRITNQSNNVPTFILFE